MTMKKLYILLLFSFLNAGAQQFGVLPVDSRKPSLKVSYDESRLIGLHNRTLAIWDGVTGELIKQISFADKNYINDNAYIYSASPDGREIAISSDRSVYLFDDEGNYKGFGEDFPFPIVGFDYKGNYIGSKSDDKGTIFISFDPKTRKATSFLHVESKDCFYKLSADGKAFVINEQGKLTTYYFPTGKVSEPKIKISDGWIIDQQPEGWIMLGQKNKKGESSKYVFYNYITGQIEEQKPEDSYLTSITDICKRVWFHDYVTTIRISDRYQWYAKTENYNNLKCMEFEKYDRKDCSKPILSFFLQQNPNEAIKQIQADTEAKYASQIPEFREFEINFQQLPSSYTLDYNTVQGRDITNLAGTRRLFRTATSVSAIGRINNCDGGGTFLVLLRRNTASSEISTFAIIKADKYGNDKGYQIITQTQKDMGNVSIIGGFTLTINGNFYTFNATKKHTNGHVETETITGSCF